MGYITINIMQKSGLGSNQVVKRNNENVEYHVGNEGFDPKKRDDRDKLAGLIRSKTGISVNTNCREWDNMSFGENKIPE